MQKVICKKVYDTETAEVVKKYTCGSFGDPAGYEETVYKTPEGNYFVYTNGGADSKYPTEDIKRLAAAKVEETVAKLGK